MSDRPIELSLRGHAILQKACSRGRCSLARPTSRAHTPARPGTDVAAAIGRMRGIGRPSNSLRFRMPTPKGIVPMQAKTALRPAPRPTPSPIPPTRRPCWRHITHSVLLARTPPPTPIPINNRSTQARSCSFGFSKRPSAHQPSCTPCHTSPP